MARTKREKTKVKLTTVNKVGPAVYAVAASGWIGGRTRTSITMPVELWDALQEQTEGPKSHVIAGLIAYALQHLRDISKTLVIKFE